MNILIAFFVFSLVIAREDTGFGTLETIEIDSRSNRAYARITNDEVLINQKGSIFNYHPGGVVLSFMSGKYLNIDDSGRLIMTDQFLPGFFVAERKDSNNQRLLTYNDDTVFQICSDLSIGYKSNCTDARDIVISYSDFSDYR